MTAFSKTKIAMQALFASTLLVAPIFGYADEPVDDVPQTVIISGSKGSELLSYRLMLAGLDAFDEYHDLAPNADKVYYKLKMNGDSAETPENVSLHIVGETTSILVPIASDGTFFLPRSTEADDEDADLVLNKKKKDFLMHIGVFSAGVPDGMRRLGDLRLECEIEMAMAKKQINFVVRATVTTFLLTSHWCNAEKLNVPSFTERPISGATIIAGEQHKELKVLKDGHGYEAPLNNKAFPDDALIEFKFVAEVEASKD